MEIKKMKGPSEQRDLMIKQLIEGIEAAKELQKRILISSTKYHHLINDDHNPQLKEDYEALNHSLLDTMLSSFDKTISIAKLMLPLDQQQKQQQPVYNFEFEGSPTHSMGLSSPRSENSHRQQHLSKKRKRMPRWSKMVNVGTTKTISGLEGPLEDGYSWRKYGQKDILGAKFPRGYYRCTHRNTQGCAATKQVQRSDENTSIFHVIYCGEHTCSTGAHLSQAQSKPEKAQIKIEPSPIQSPPEQPQAQTSHYPDQQEIFVGLGSDGSLKVEPAESERPAQLFRSFSFTPVLLESGPTDNFLVDPTFGSPATSDSEHFPMYQIVGHGGGLQVQTSESDFNGSISGPSSVANSPNGFDFEFLLDPLLDIDAEFHF